MPHLSRCFPRPSSAARECWEMVLFVLVLAVLVPCLAVFAV